MQIPGMPGAMEDPAMREKAEQEAEQLLDELKKEVKAEVKDIGVLRKELQITVPAKIISNHLEHNFDELRHDAIVPGFRKGRAPIQLIQKRFGGEVRESLTTTIIGQSFFAVVENNELDVLGDPLFQIPADEGIKLVDLNEALQKLKLPESGDFSYACEVEVKPAFELPELEGIEVKTPEIEITDEMLNNEILRQRKIRGRYEPQPEGAAEKDDLLVADVVLQVEDNEIKREENVQIGVRPSGIDGIELPKLDETLLGAKIGESRTAECTLPEDYERADLRGKPGHFEFKVHEIKRLVPMLLEDFLKTAGFDQEQEARDYQRMLMENERDDMIARAKKEQVYEYLLKSTSLELPEQHSARQTERAVARRMIDLRQRGMPEGDIEARIDELRTSAQEDVSRDLKLGFILAKVAEKLEIDVTDEQVNTEIARIARLYNRRFDRIRDDLQKQDLLPQLAEQIRQDKCITRLLEGAKLESVKADESADKEQNPAEEQES
ncbi:MAG: trigger factor [Planctomycetota bacterium]